MKTGDIFTTNQGYRIVVVEYISALKVKIKFLDDFGVERFARADHIRKGAVNNPYAKTVYNIGFLGEGDHSPTRGGSSTLAGKRWRQMIKRCYEPGYQKRNPSYIGCTVHPDWHNFQNFAKWHDEQKNHQDETLHLDKDLIKDGNKQYGPDVCSLVPRRINALIGVVRRKNGLPTGVSYNRKSRLYQVDCRDEHGEPRYLGFYETPEQAFYAYKEFKESSIKKVALDFKDQIDERVFSYLMSYEVPGQ